jgi:alkaline phosphatase D
MPIEQPPALNGLEGHLQMFGAYRFGPAQVNLLDTRQYRSDQVCGQGFPGDFPCGDLQNPALTMTGASQEAWLLDQMKTSTAPFNVLASQTWFAPFEYIDDPKARKWNMDQWDGYPVQRQRLIDAMANVSNPVILSGDWHSALASTIYRNPLDARSQRIGHNFAATSISSVCSWWPDLHRAKDANPHVSHVDGKQRGYLRCEVDSKRFGAVFRTVTDPANDMSAVVTDKDIRTSDI